MFKLKIELRRVEDEKSYGDQISNIEVFIRDDNEKNLDQDKSNIIAIIENLFEILRALKFDVINKKKEDK